MNDLLGQIWNACLVFWIGNRRIDTETKQEIDPRGHLTITLAVSLILKNVDKRMDKRTVT